MKRQYKFILLLFSLFIIFQFLQIQTISAIVPIPGNWTGTNYCQTDAWCVDALNPNSCQTAKCNLATSDCYLEQNYCAPGSSCDIATGSCASTGCLINQTYSVTDCVGTYNETVVNSSEKANWNSTALNWATGDLYFNDGTLAQSCAFGAEPIIGYDTINNCNGVIGSIYSFKAPNTVTNTWDSVTIDSVSGLITQIVNTGFSLYGTSTPTPTNCNTIPLLDKCFLYAPDCTPFSSCLSTKTLCPVGQDIVDSCSGSYSRTTGTPSVKIDWNGVALNWTQGDLYNYYTENYGTNCGFGAVPILGFDVTNDCSDILIDGFYRVPNTLTNTWDTITANFLSPIGDISQIITTSKPLYSAGITTTSTSCIGLNSTDCSATVGCNIDKICGTASTASCSAPDTIQFDSCSGSYNESTGNFVCTGIYNKDINTTKIDWTGAPMIWNLGQEYQPGDCGGYKISSCTNKIDCLWSKFQYSFQTYNSMNEFDPACGYDFRPAETPGVFATLANALGYIWENKQFSCSDFNNDGTTCSATSGCTYTDQPITKDCSGLLESACSSQSSCVYNTKCVKAIDVIPTVLNTVCTKNGRTTNLTILYSDVTSSSQSKVDICTNSTDKIIFSCSGTSPSQTITNTTSTCTYGCDQNTAECIAQPTLSVEWSQTSGTDVVNSPSVANFKVDLILHNPGSVTTTDFNIFERDAGDPNDGINDTVTTVTANKNEVGDLVANYTFTTTILPIINDNGNETGYFDFFFTSPSFSNIISNNLELFINDTHQVSSCPTDPLGNGEFTSHYNDKICDIKYGETFQNCPLDCFNPNDGICDADLGENYYNSPLDCPSIIQPRIVLMYGNSFYHQNQEIRGDISLNNNSIDKNTFILAYLGGYVSSSEVFKIYGWNSNSLWEKVRNSISITDTNLRDYQAANWTLKYNDFWSLDLPQSQTLYTFNETFGSLNNLSKFQLNGNISTCTDGVKNGAETGIDCGGECSTSCPTDPGCSVIAACTQYTNQSSCISNACNLDQTNSECYWNTASLPNSCDTQTLGLSGTCKYASDPSNTDNCTDGFYKYSYDATFAWNKNFKLNNRTTWSEGYSKVSEGVYYYDPEGDFIKCQSATQVIACPAQVKLSFWTWQNILATVGLIFLGYYYLGSRKKKVKKKLSSKKSKK